MVKKKVLGQKPTTSDTTDAENVAMGDGISLEQGSPEYNARVADQKGMDIFDQVRQKKIRAGWLTEQERRADQDSVDANKSAAKIAKESAAAGAKAAFTRDVQMSGQKHAMAQRNQKIGMTDDLIKEFRDQAEEVDDKKADKAARRLPSTLEDIVYDSSVNAAEYTGPGAKVLNKFS